MIGGVKLHEIDAVTEAVVGAQLWQMPVGLARQVLDLLASDQSSGLLQVIRRPSSQLCIVLSLRKSAGTKWRRTS
jgi:hypothetical protein